MNTSVVTQQYDVAKNGTLFTHRKTHSIGSREYDTAGWTFEAESAKASHPSLAFLPILALIILVICSLLKLYKRMSHRSKMKARGDVEFCDEDDITYGIISPGDKDFCPVDMRSDGTSVYDTVNSMRILGNGFSPLMGGPHPNQDTVTSFKSLVMQRPDGGQYDSVKSYKAFLQKVTQNKDLAVEVKLLENYPIRSKSTEHCVVLEEESSERSGDVAAKILGSLPLKKQLHEGRMPQCERKRPRHRRASGDIPAALRKRSASNPTCRRLTGASLPSVRYPLSSDSDEDTQQSLKMDRKRLWAERKKISRSVSGSKIAKETNGAALSKPAGPDNVKGYIQKRRRHFSADSARRPRKTILTQIKDCSSKVLNPRPDLKNIDETKPRNAKTVTKNKKNIPPKLDDSSSENPHSSHSSCDSNMPSDVMISDSDDEDTKQNTLISNTSDDRTLDNEVFYSLDSGAELASSSEILQSSPKRLMTDTKKSIARAKEDFFKREARLSPLIPPPSIKGLGSVEAVSDTQNSCNLLKPSADLGTKDNHIPQHQNHSRTVKKNSHQKLQQMIGSSLGSQADSVSASSKSSISTDNILNSNDSSTLNIAQNNSNEDMITPNVSSPRKVQRFHVTFVSGDNSSLKSE